MIRPRLSHIHICKRGHVSTNNSAKIDRCSEWVSSNKEEYLRNKKNGHYDEKKNMYFKHCNEGISKSLELPKEFEFTQVYSREIFDGMLKGQELSEFFYELHKNVAQIHLALDEIAQKINIRLRGAGNKRRKK